MNESLPRNNTSGSFFKKRARKFWIVIRARPGSLVWRERKSVVGQPVVERNMQQHTDIQHTNIQHTDIQHTHTHHHHTIGSFSYLNMSCANLIVCSVPVKVMILKPFCWLCASLFAMSMRQALI